MVALPGLASWMCCEELGFRARACFVKHDCCSTSAHAGLHFDIEAFVST